MFKNYLGKIKRAILLILVLCITIFSGCGKKSDLVEDTSKDELPTEQQEEEEESATRVIKDIAGREITIPRKINKVFTTSAVGTIALYTIDPSKIAGLNSEVGELEERYLTKEYLELPVLGSYKGKDSGNEEEILKAEPDIIISMGDINDRWISEADEAQEKLGIPFLMINGDLETLNETYEFLGDILGEEERARELAGYCKMTIEDTKEVASNIPEDKKISVYYASTQGPLTTNVTGSIHTQAIELVGAINAAEVTVEKMSGGVEVSMEQVLNWNPARIIAAKGMKGNEGSYDIITKDSKWGTIKAVEDGEVYAIPNAPFNWFDRPPSVNRIIGVRWLGNLLYPEEFKIDIKEETKNFYKMFYHCELTDSEVEEILEGAISK